MVITGRFFALVLAGAIPTVLFPHYWVVLAWVAVCVALLLIDLAVVGNPTRTRIASSAVRSGSARPIHPDDAAGAQLVR